MLLNLLQERLHTQILIITGIFLGIIFKRMEVPGMDSDAILSCFINGIEEH